MILFIFLHSSYEKFIKNTLKPYSDGSAFPRGREICVSHKSEQNESHISVFKQTNVSIFTIIRQIPHYYQKLKSSYM